MSPGPGKGFPGYWAEMPASQMADYLFRQDTIGAIATPPGRSAIGIIRISGPETCASLSPLWRGRDLSDLAPRTLSLGRIETRDGEILDEVLLAVMKAPHCYTGEDMAEIHCHGNPRILAAILRALVQEGVRTAEPGEFTFRAFRNGRMSLLQAEAVAELIEAKGEWARQNALSVLAEEGDTWVRELLDSLLGIWVPIEADLEFPTDDLDSIRLEESIPALRNLHERIEDLDRRASHFSKLQEGYRVVIAGAQNAGKSSLLNALLGYNRALVTEIPGTTRDTLEENIEIRGIPIRLIDTAGLGEARDVLDAQGMERSRSALKDADLVILVVDTSIHHPPEKAAEAGNILPAEDLYASCPVIVVGNKVDMLSASSLWHNRDEVLLISAKEATGLDTLTHRIGETFVEEGVVSLEERLMLNQRQAEALRRCREAVERCISNITSAANQDLVATDLIDAKNALEELSGKAIQVDLMESIFSRFCIGK